MLTAYNHKYSHTFHVGITLVIQIVTSSFPTVASRKKYMKLDVKGALLSYVLILLLLFFSILFKLS